MYEIEFSNHRQEWVCYGKYPNSKDGFIVSYPDKQDAINGALGLIEKYG